MKISLIVAMDENRGIGKNNQLPWRLSTDLKRFKALTMGHHLILGRKTYESISRPLPGRTMIILSRDPAFQPPGSLTASSLERALELASSGGEEEVFILGGGDVFSQVLPLADRIYLTQVHTRVDADVFFPSFNAEDWQVTERSDHPAGDNDAYAHSYCRLERKISEKLLDKS